MEKSHHLLENPAETRLLPHMPQLDGIRAIAVLMVMWHHFQPRYLAVSGGGGAPWGAVGVGLFFTLSGFLITRILLRCKLKVAAGEAGVGAMLKQFYVRRCLRIFPLYYAAIAVLWVINPTDFRDRVWWHVGYLSNVAFSYYVPRSVFPIERHFWSLAVEEQFYLFWPLLMFVTPRRLLLPLILLMIAVAPVWSITTYTRGAFGHEWMTPACLGLLGSGALLALFSLPEFGWHRWWNTLIQTAGVIGVPLFFIYVTSKSISVKIAATQPGEVAAPQASFFGVVNETPVGRSGWIDLSLDWPGGAHYPITAVLSIFVIGMAARGFRGPLGWLLQCAPLVYVGRISYGLYVVHMFMPHVAVWINPKWAKEKDWEQLCVYVAASLIVATISWYAFEAPINRLKKYFEYDDSRVGASTPGR